MSLVVWLLLAMLLGVDELALVLLLPTAGGAVPAGLLLPLLQHLLKGLMDLEYVLLGCFFRCKPLLTILTCTGS